MTEQLISFETALLVKEKGFDWLVGYAYGLSGKSHQTRLEDWNNFKLHDQNTSAPTQSLLQKWLRDEHKIYVSVERCVIGSDEWEFGYFIEWLPKEHHNDKRRVGFFKEKRSFQDNYPYNYVGAWHTYEHGLEEGLKEALKLL